MASEVVRGRGQSRARSYIIIILHTSSLKRLNWGLKKGSCIISGGRGATPYIDLSAPTPGSDAIDNNLFACAHRAQQIENIKIRKEII